MYVMKLFEKKRKKKKKSRGKRCGGYHRKKSNWSIDRAIFLEKLRDKKILKTRLLCKILYFFFFFLKSN